MDSTVRSAEATSQRDDATVSVSDRKQRQSPAKGPTSTLRLMELQLVAFIIVLSACGLVPMTDLLFPAFVSAYLLCLERVAFPHRKGGGRPMEIFKGGKVLRLFVVTGTIIGLFLPLAYVVGGFARGDSQAAMPAALHLFLLSFQILTENILSELLLFSPPVRALVPLFYTARRVPVLMDWMNIVWFNNNLPAYASLQDTVWFWFGKILSGANLVYFSCNFFCFLIPRLLPRAFEVYFMEKAEITSKRLEEKGH